MITGEQQTINMKAKMKIPNREELSLLDLMMELKDPISLDRLKAIHHENVKYPKRLVQGCLLVEDLEGKLSITEHGEAVAAIHPILANTFKFKETEIKSLVTAYPLTTLYTLKALVSPHIFRTVSTPSVLAKSGEFTTIGARYCEAIIRFNYGEPDLLDVSSKDGKDRKALIEAFKEAFDPEALDGDSDPEDDSSDGGTVVRI